MAISRRETIIPAPYVLPPTQKFDGEDGRWSTFAINVGTPGQNFRVLMSTASSETWLPAPEGCLSTEPGDCPSLRGADPFNGAASPGFQYNISSSWEYVGLYGVDFEKHLNYTAAGLYGYDRVGLGTAQHSAPLSIDRQVVAAIADKDYFMGMLGLGIRETSFSSTSEPVPGILQNLYDQNLIPSPSYSYTAGAKYRLKGQFGTLILGGYDETKFTTSTDFSFTFSSQDSRTLTVGVQSIVGYNTLLGVASLTASGHLSLIDSTVPHLWLPASVCDVFERAFGLTYDPATDLYLVNDTSRAQLQELNPTITFKLGNSQYDDGKSINIELPYGAFDQQAGWPIYSEPTNYFPIRRAANDTQYTLGRVLLQEAYLIVDNERRNFSLAQAAFTDPAPEPNIITIKSVNATQSESESDSGLGTPAIAGIAVGAAAVIIAIIGLAIFFFVRRRRRARTAELDDTQAATGVSDSNEGPAHGGQKPHELDSPEIQELASPAQPSAFFNQKLAADRMGVEGMQELPSPPPVHPVVHELPAETEPSVLNRNREPVEI